MRAYVGALIHETNAFSPVPTDRHSYAPATLGYRELLGAAADAGLTVHRGLSFRAAPSAPTAREDYEYLRDNLVADIAGNGPFDLILLALHGAQVAAGYPDCEGDLLAALREAVGDTVAVAVLLDLHASVSTPMLRHADLVASIKEYPHTDYPECAGKLVALGMRLVRGEISPVTAFVPLPLFTLWHTPQAPSSGVVAAAREFEQSGKALYVSLVHGFPWSNVPDAGASVLVVTDNDPAYAAQLAEYFAHSLWDIRDADLGHYVDIDACMAIARGMTGGPLVIADAADNPGAGCGGDATWLLHALLRSDVSGAGIAMLVDPRAVEHCVAAGEGASLQLSLGGYSGPLAGAPLAGEFHVVAIRPDARIDGMPGSPPIEGVCLVRLRHRGLEIVISDYREQVFGPAVFTAVGLDPAALRVVVVKSAQHFYHAFAPLAARVVYADTPCSRTIDFSRLPLRDRRRPVWPLEAVAADAIPAAELFTPRKPHGQAH